MEKFNLDFLKDVLSLPSYSGHEDMVIEYIIDYAKENNYSVIRDNRNIYLKKGNAKYFPCVVCHIDTVFSEHVTLVKQRLRKDIVYKDGIIKAFDPITKERTGLGGDDLAGLFVCLTLIKHIPNIKAAFFVEEEKPPFAVGSRNLSNYDFFKDVGYFVEFDAPGFNNFPKYLMGRQLFTDEFYNEIKDLLIKYQIHKLNHDPITDVHILREKFDVCCCNIPVGYHNAHTSQEYVNVVETMKAISFAYNMINTLGERLFYYEKYKPIKYNWNKYYNIDWDDNIKK